MTEDNTLPAPLDSAEHWTMYWRDMVKSIDFGKSGFYDIALFIFCMLNQKNKADTVRISINIMGIIDNEYG